MISKHIFTSDVVSGKAFWLNNLQSTGNLVTANSNFTITNDATILGDLTVKGSTTTIDTVTLTVDDHNIELGSVDNPTDSTADGGGITLKGSSDKTFNWSSASNAWESNVGLNVLGGYVGIGTASPSVKLDVKTDSFGDIVRLITLDGTNDPRLLIGSSATGIYIKNSWNTGAGNLDFQTADGTSKMYIKSNGNVGIGTTSPDSLLHLQKSVASGDAEVLMLRNPLANAVGESVSIAFQGATQIDMAKIEARTQGANASGAPCDLVFQTASNGSAASDRMTIDSNGNVGIGTTDPDKKLEVVLEDDTAYGTGGTGRGIRVKNESQSASSYTSLELIGGIAAHTSIARIHAIQDNITNASTSLAFTLRTSSNSTEERLRIASNGNVGIGTTNPDYKLHVDGGGYFAGEAIPNIAPANGIYLGESAGGPSYHVSIISPKSNSSYIDFSTIERDAIGRILYAHPDANLSQGMHFYSDYSNSITPADLFIQPNGNVGIGTTSPEARLTIAQPGTTIGGNDISKGCLLAGSAVEGIGIDNNEIIKKGALSTSAFVIGNANSEGAIHLKTNLQDRLVIKNSGASITGTLTTSSAITINNSNPVFILRDTNGGDVDTQSGFISYRDNSDTERGYVGFGSVGNKDFSVTNRIGDINLSTKSGGKVYVPTSLRLGNGVTLAESSDRADMLKIQGITSGYAGVVISNTNGEDLWSLMADGDRWGVYNDSTNEWHIQCNDNGAVDLFYNNVEKLNTSSSGISINGNIDKVTDIYLQDQIIHHGDTDTYMQFHAGNQWRVVAGGDEIIECTNTAFNVAKNTSMAADLTVEGDLTVNGDLVTLNTTNLDVSDKVITVAKTDNPTHTTADDSGISFGGMASILYDGDNQRVYIASSSFDGDSITNNTITNAKLSNMAGNTIKLRDGSASGDPDDFALTDKDILICNGNGFTATSLSGDVSMSNDGSVSIAANKVTNAKLSNMTGNTIKLRNGSASGDPDDFALTDKDILICNGDGFTATSLSGDVSMSNDGSVSIGADKVTFSKIQNTGAGIVGRTSSNSGDVSSLSASSVRTFLNVAEIIDEDDFVSDSSAKVPSQQSVKAFVESAISSVDIDTTDLITKSDSNTQSIVSNFTVGGFLTVNGANTSGQSIIAAQDIVAMSSNTSDERLKENILKIDSALNKVCSLEGFTFNWNTKAKSIGISSPEKQIGLSAQSTEKVFPEAVKKLPDSEYKYINYEKLVPALVESIKELKAEIEELKKKI